MNCKKISIIGMLAALALSSFGDWTYKPTSGNWSTNGLKSDGTKTTITFHTWDEGFVFAKDCGTVAVSNFTFIYDPLPISGGEIKYHSGNTIKFTPKAGLNSDFAWLLQMHDGSFHTPAGKLISGTLQNYSVTVSDFSAGTVTCTVASAPVNNMTGNYMFIYARTTTGIGEFQNCDKVILKNITFKGNPSIAFSGTEIGELEVSNVDTSLAASFMTGGRDAFNFGNIRKATFTGCNLQGLGDDCINLHSIGRMIASKSADNKTITLQSALSTRWMPTQSCIILRTSDNTCVYTGTISNCDYDNKKITFSTPITAAVGGYIVYNDRMCGWGGLIITNNTFSTGRRNALMMTPVCSTVNKGNISGNTFEHFGLRAFYTHHDDAGAEGYRSTCVNIHDNYFSDLALAGFPKNSFVTISLLKEVGWQGISGVNVQTNVFDCLSTNTGIRITDAKTCNLSGNTNSNHVTIQVIKANTSGITP